MSDLDTQIENAIRNGAKIKDIAAHLDQSEDPSHKAWANNYFQRPPIEAATPKNDGVSEGFGSKTDEFAAEERAKQQEKKKSKEVTVDIAGQSFAIPEWLQVPGAAALGGAAAVGTGMAARKLFGGGEPPPPPPPSAGPAISISEAQKQIDDLRLQREQMKTQQAQVKHEAFLAKNQLSDVEKAFGRKAKDPSELRLMETAVKQQTGIAPTVPTTTTPAPIPFELDEYSKSGMRTIQEPKTPVVPSTVDFNRPNPYMAETPPVVADTAPAQAKSPLPPPVQPPAAAPVAPVGAPPISAGSPTGTVVATAATPEGVTTATQAMEKAKEAVAPTTKAKASIFSAAEKKTIPGAERQLLGTFGYGSNPERAQAILNGVKGGLPENTPLAFDVNEKGMSKGGMPNKSHVLSTTNRLMGTNMSADDFKAFRFTDENLNKMHTALQKEMEAAKTPAQIAKAQQGFADLAVMARTAGNALGALALFEAYKHGKKTGDWSDLGLGVTGQIIGNIAPRMAAPFALMTPTTMGSGTLDSPESKALFDRVYTKQVGAGRGVAPPSAYMR
jgi:hypothetical protein